MPDRPKCVAQAICEACAVLIDPPCISPSSHLEICFVRETLPAKYAERGACNQQAPRKGCDGLCDNCPMRLTPLPQTNPQLHAAASSTPLVVDEETTRVTATPDFPYRKGVRRRPGQENRNLEIRPPGFKKKLWLGSYTCRQSLSRACDACKFYTGSKEDQYILLDSEETFGNFPLSIPFECLDPLCDKGIVVGSKDVLAHRYFGREVRRVIKLVIDQDKKMNADRIAHERKVALRKMPVGQTSPDPVELPTRVGFPNLFKVGAPLMIPASIEAINVESSPRPALSSGHDKIGENLVNPLLASTSSGLPATPLFRFNAASGDIASMNVLGDTECVHVPGFEFKAGNEKDMPGKEHEATIAYCGDTANIDDLLMGCEDESPADVSGDSWSPLIDEDLLDYFGLT